MRKVLKGKRCLITGANSGIGKATAIQLAQQGAQIIMACRNPIKAEEAKKEVIFRSGNERVEVMLVDFAKQDEIRALADEFKSKYQQLDILVNNAGIIADQRKVTQEGYELTFAVNHLGYFLVTNLLLEELKASPSARIINVSSEAHRMGKINFDDLHLERDYSNIKAYSNSKLANILFTHELAKKLKETPVTVNALHPGVVNSNFAENSSMFLKTMMVLARPFMVSIEKGAETSIYLASSEEVAGISGRYFVRKKAKAPSADASNPALAKKLWDISLELTGLI
ncbi:MAG: SDR family oxidoreductase [Flammeovirgaceae bacterium]